MATISIQEVACAYYLYLYTSMYIHVAYHNFKGAQCTHWFILWWRLDCINPPSSQSAAVTVTSTQCCSCIGTITFKHLILWHFLTSNDILIVSLVFLIVSLLLATQVTFNPTQYTVSEDDGDVVLTLLASKPASFDYTVHVDTVNGTAVGQLFWWSPHMYTDTLGIYLSAAGIRTHACTLHLCC